MDGTYNLESPGHRKRLREVMAQSKLSVLRIVSDALVDHVRKTSGLTSPMAFVLVHLLFHPDDYEPAQIADGTMVPRQTMTSVLDALEKAGFAVRKDHPTDRRKKKVVLTGRGVSKAFSILDELRKFEADLIADLTPEETEAYAHFMSKILARLSKRGDGVYGKQEVLE